MTAPPVAFLPGTAEETALLEEASPLSSLWKARQKAADLVVQYTAGPQAPAVPTLWQIAGIPRVRAVALGAWSVGECLPLADILAPAIALARQGFLILPKSRDFMAEHRFCLVTCHASQQAAGDSHQGTVTRHAGSKRIDLGCLVDTHFRHLDTRFIGLPAYRIEQTLFDFVTRLINNGHAGGALGCPL